MTAPDPTCSHCGHRREDHSQLIGLCPEQDPDQPDPGPGYRQWRETSFRARPEPETEQLAKRDEAEENSKRPQATPEALAEAIRERDEAQTELAYWRGEAQALRAETDAAQHAAYEARAKLGRIETWTLQHGAALCPPGPDTYGEGMRDAKAQVRKLLGSTSRPCQRA